MDLAELNEIIGKVHELAATLRDVRDRIENNRSTYSGNETNTRNGLINPVLERLGWDVTDPDLVSAEYPMGGGKVDYVLKAGDDPIAVIEAKNLGSRLGADVTAQVLNYISDDRTVKYAIATNGDHWQMQIRGERKLAVDLILTERQEYETALVLMKISRDVSVSTSNGANRDSDTSAGGGPKSDPRDRCSQQRRRSSDLDVCGNWKRIDDRSIDAQLQKPKIIRFSDGTEINVANWREVYISLANWMIRAGWITTANIPVKLSGSRTRCAVNTELKHPGGQPFWDGRELENGLFLELDTGSVTRDLSYAVKLISAVGMEPDAIEVLIT